MNNKKITDTILYLGVNDHEVDLFEGQYVVPNGMAYNSYAIVDEKVAIMDTVDARFTHEWLDNIQNALGDRKPDYLIVQHMEPDHSANIAEFMKLYTEATVVSSEKAFTMMKNFFGTDYADRRIVVGEGSTLSLGKHTLTFVTAPMVHWPEVIVTYDALDKVLFSADGFGKFGALDTDEDWDCEARRYYFNIVGKYGGPVQTLLKKAAALDIQTICPLHGPILTEDLGHYIGKYQIWSSYQPENEGVTIVCASIHGNTLQAAKKLQEILEARGVKVSLFDLSRDDKAEAVEDAFRYDKLVLAAASYDGGVFLPMENFLCALTAKAYQNRKVALVENGSWAPCAARVMKGYLEKMKKIDLCPTTVTIKSTLKDADVAKLEQLADELLG